MSKAGLSRRRRRSARGLRLAAACGALTVLVCAGGAALLPAAVAGAANCINLYSSSANPSAYSEYGDGSAFVDGDNVAGPVAYDDSIDILNSTFSTTSVSPASTVTMVLGTTGASINDPVTLTYGSADYVGTLSGGTITTSQAGASANSVTTSPLNFSAADSALSSAASQFDLLTTTGTITTGTTLSLSGTVSGTNVFDLTAATLEAASTINISVPSGASVLVNVTGNYSGSHQSVTVSGTSASNVVWNFEGPATLKNESPWVGTLLGASHGLTVDNSTVDGSLLDTNSAYFYENTVGLDLYAGCISSSPPTGAPEAPVGILLPVAAVAVMGGAVWTVRRRRSVHLPA